MYKITLFIISLTFLTLAESDICYDSLYLELKKNIGNLSEQEYQYFIEKDRICNESILNEEQSSNNEDNQRYYYPQQTQKETELDKEVKKSTTEANKAVVYVLALVLGWLVGKMISSAIY